MIWLILIVVAIILISRSVSEKEKNKRGYYDAELAAARSCRLVYEDALVKKDLDGTYYLVGRGNAFASRGYNRVPCYSFYIDGAYLATSYLDWDSLVLYDANNRPLNMRNFTWFFEPVDQMGVNLFIWRH